MAGEHTLLVKRFEPKDGRLGRHVVHDSRSLRYPFRAVDPRKLKSTRHAVNIPILDQGYLGACTGYAGTAAMASAGLWTAGQTVLKDADHGAFAVGLYSDATKLDPWPGEYVPDDTGSDGLSVAKALHARGLVAGYQHATSLEACLTALAERVVMIGSSWLERMYDVDSDGKMNVSGNSVGGHEYVLDELDVENRRVWMRNSWGEEYGQKGRAWMLWGDLGRLLADYGDCTILVPNSEPMPAPVEPEPKPEVPTPTPAPVTPTKDPMLVLALTKFLKTKGVPAYVRKPATSWLKE